MTRLTVTKAHGLGNDFLLLFDGPFDADVARRLCDRHRGVGGDGLIQITHSGGRWRMDLRNADGGVAEISGNGLRCVARLLHQRGLVGPDFELDTAAGPKVVHVDGDGIRVDMGEPISIPGPTGPAAQGLDVEALSLGNPHVVVFVADPAQAPVTDLGPRLEHDPAFPDRTNVEFVAVLDRHRVRGRIWERGVGETEASGTGGSACAVAARLRGMVDETVAVELPGGTLGIQWAGPGNSVIMTGPAVVLFEVEVELDVVG